jgi:hypothetical protein
MSECPDQSPVGPVHHAWTVGNGPCVLIDTGIAAYAMPARGARSCTLVSSAALTLGNRHAEP